MEIINIQTGKRFEVLPGTLYPKKLYREATADEIEEASGAKKVTNTATKRKTIVRAKAEADGKKKKKGGKKK